MAPAARRPCYRGVRGPSIPSIKVQKEILGKLSVFGPGSYILPETRNYQTGRNSRPRLGPKRSSLLGPGQATRLGLGRAPAPPGPAAGTGPLGRGAGGPRGLPRPPSPHTGPQGPTGPVKVAYFLLLCVCGVTPSAEVRRFVSPRPRGRGVCRQGEATCRSGRGHPRTRGRGYKCLPNLIECSQSYIWFLNHFNTHYTCFYVFLFLFLQFQNPGYWLAQN